MAGRKKNAPPNSFTYPHKHIFLSDNHHVHEQRTWFVIALTLITMIIEIIAGLVYGSMALLADGWHMASHASAMGITALAYYMAKRHADNNKFSFGTGKIGDLGAYSSALVLALIALIMAYASIMRLYHPVEINFNDAILVACVGLVVNLVSAILLKERHTLGHDDVDQDHGHHHRDHNLRAAYLHVLSDALTSILAIIALAIGRFWGIILLDPLMGIVGAVIISVWAYGLMRETGSILLDINHDDTLKNRIKEAFKQHDSECDIQDLHIWRIGPGHYSAAISVLSSIPSTPDGFKAHLCDIRELSHVTVEVNGFSAHQP